MNALVRFPLLLVSGFLLFAGGGAELAAQAGGQDRSTTDGGTTIGVVVGGLRTSGLWKPAAESTDVLGGALGGYVLAQTPASALSIYAEVAFVQRNSDVLGSNQGQPLMGGLRTDYLSVTIAPRLSGPVGPLRVFASAGLTLDQVMRARLDATLSPVLREVETVVGATGSVGFGSTVSDWYRVEGELRFFESLGDTHSGDFLQLRSRSVGVAIRVGIPIPDSWRSND